MVCTRQAYLARSGSRGSPMPGKLVAVRAAGPIGHLSLLGLAGAVVVSRWKRAGLYATPEAGPLSINAASQELEGCASVALYRDVCRSMHRAGASACRTAYRWLCVRWPCNGCCLELTLAGRSGL